MRLDAHLSLSPPLPSHPLVGVDWPFNSIPRGRQPSGQSMKFNQMDMTCQDGRRLVDRGQHFTLITLYMH